MFIEGQKLHSKPRVMAQTSSEVIIEPHVILADAREKAQQAALQYAGDISPHDAWILLSSGIAELVDVRTERELHRVGYVPGTKHVEWLKGMDMQKNLRFISELTAKVSKNDVVLFLCRSGKRSVAAAEAASQDGYRNAFNVLEGFEGDGNPQQGWLHHGLPSTQE